MSSLSTATITTPIFMARTGNNSPASNSQAASFSTPERPKSKKSETPLVSIIIPCYNAENYVAEAIQSALDQIYPNCEIIVIDDGSTDGSLEVIKSFGDKIRWETGPNRGGCGARNRGLELAKGEWIQFLDADDLIEQNKIAVQMKLAAEHGSECLISGCWKRFRKSIDDNTFPMESKEMPEQPADWLIQKYSGRGMMAAHAWLSPVALIERTEGWDTSLKRDQDGEFFDHLASLASRIVHSPDAFAHYRVTEGGGVSARKDGDGFRSVLQVQIRGTQRLVALRDCPEAHNACSRSFMRIAMESFPQYRDISQEALALAEEHGGASAPVSGGPIVKLVQKVLGWRAARRVHVGMNPVRELRNRVRARLSATSTHLINE